MYVKISDDLIIDYTQILYVRKSGKDIFLKLKNGDAMAFTSYEKEGKALLDFSRKMGIDPLVMLQMQSCATNVGE